MAKKIRTLLFSTLFPSSVRPGHGIFVKTRLQHLLSSDDVETQVVAPVPWFPSANPTFGQWAKNAATPKFEEIDDIKVWHPRYLLPPKLGMSIAPVMLALGARRQVRKLIDEGFDFDLIDAHYYYPDGVAAALLASAFKKPLVITARGTDLNLLPEYTIPRRWILWAESRAAASVGVCRALMDRLEDLGGSISQKRVLRNGVDLRCFVPEDKAASRRKLGLPTGDILISVGNLVELKGHHLAIEALPSLPGATLVIVGEGEEEARLRELANRLSMSNRVIFAGRRPQTELSHWYSAADVLVLCSSREGWANVLLEAMACGTPVVATAVSGTPEVIQTSEVGRLMSDRSSASLVQALQELLSARPEQSAVRRYAEGFDWNETTRGQIELFRDVAGDAHA